MAPPGATTGRPTVDSRRPTSSPASLDYTLFLRDALAEVGKDQLTNKPLVETIPISDNAEDEVCGRFVRPEIYTSGTNKSPWIYIAGRGTTLFKADRNCGRKGYV